MTLERSREGRAMPIAEINITPLVDVMLTVLIIFMITAPIMTKKIDLPLLGGADHAKVEPKVMGLSIKNTGELYLDGEAVNRASLDANLRVAKANGAHLRLEIRPDADSAYDNLATVLAIAKNVEIDDLRVEAPRH
jgi:biopolymer transport protein ExbD